MINSSPCLDPVSLIPSTGCSLNILFFPENFVIFLNSASSAASLVFYLPGVCTHTESEGKQRKGSDQFFPNPPQFIGQDYTGFPQTEKYSCSTQ